MALSQDPSAPTHHRVARPLAGITLKVGATFVFTIMAVLARKLGGAIPVVEVVFFRCAFAFIPLLSWMVIRGIGISTLKTNQPWSHARRAMTGVCAMFSYFGALTFLPVADLTAIGFASPLIVVILAATVLGEVVRLYRWSAVAAGFIGVMIMVSPHVSGDFGHGSSIGVGLALANAVFVAFTMIFIRMMSASEPALTIAFYFQLASACVSGLITIFMWVTPSAEQLVLLVSLGVLGGIGQLLMTNSYRFADASTLANFDYAAMVWAILFGWLVFSELPPVEVFVGAVVVIGSGLFIAWREQKLGLARAAADTDGS
jgi:drug/metabolite transporter (DMT)-like permease